MSNSFKPGDRVRTIGAYRNGELGVYQSTVNGCHVIRLDDDDMWRPFEAASVEILEPAPAVSAPGTESLEDDHFARELTEARRRCDMDGFARVLSGRLRQMDKRARAANIRADAAEARLATAQAERDAEREECAKVCDEHALAVCTLNGTDHTPGSKLCAQSIASAIRSRSALARSEEKAG